ncbi:hypothetical protein BDW42DRAFT_197410 [Aspergillus taichungensis]|uniref:Bactericidal permeability-increasing protein n=1 Tax=Aspergillus taichungensis TaxID=482145 RepID=A0A2J5HGH4_9EURO|nr:hypothetical protein BDW42DRAFT_197410 [Aspergillus taichungensis]
MSQGEREPLLPRYEEDTTRQRRLHQKLHTYQMLRALAEGYMPSTDQTVVHLRTLLASDVLNPRNLEIGSVGRQLIRDARLWIQLFIDLLHQKNGDDQLQQLLWHLARSRVALDPTRVSQHAAHKRATADTKAAYDSLQTVGRLLLTNSDFRIFVEDVTTVGRQIFADTAGTLSSVAHEASEELQPSPEEAHAVEGAGADEGPPPSNEDLQEEASHIADVVENVATRTGKQAVRSARDHFSGAEKETLLHRLKQAVEKLRQRTDYSDSVSTLARLVQRYAKIYTSAASEIVTAAEEEAEINVDLKQAMREFWNLLQTFGDSEEWKTLEERCNRVLRHANEDPEFETLMSEVGSSIQEMLTDPSFFDSAEERIGELQEKSTEIGAGTTLRSDVDAFLAQAKRALRSIPQDLAVSRLIDATHKLYQDAWDGYYDWKSELPMDLLEVVFPLLLRSLQYIPIPRLEITSPELDLLLENLVLEPGHTVNFSSFLPYRLHVTTRNDIDILKRHSKQTAAGLKTTFTASVWGLNLSAEEFGYWVRAHPGSLFRFNDEGIASFALDRRGIDISLDVEVGRDRLEQIFTLRSVRVRIYKLSYKVHRSKWKLLLWLAKPFLKHLVRRVLEKKIAENIVEAATALNRELVFARERLRAARIAQPKDLASFVRAVLARLKPAGGDVEARVGLDAPGSGVFKGVYAPGSLTKVWREQATRAQEAIEEGDESQGLGRTWRNDIFDVPR